VEELHIVFEVLLGETPGVASNIVLELSGVFVFAREEPGAERRECDDFDAQLICCCY
jgi:hypothetical protein